MEISGGGGSGPKHSAFFGACFSINPYSSLFGQNRQKSTPKNREPSVFFMAQIFTFFIIFDPQNRFLNLSLPISISTQNIINQLLRKIVTV
jgi:hypothetical protein